MKIFELLGIKKTIVGKNPRELVNFFNETTGKLRMLGKGAHAIALTDGKYVYKFWYVDDAYERFAKLCLSTSKPYLPKLVGRIRTLPRILKVKGSDELKDVRYVKMEKLSPINPRDIEIKIFDDDTLKRIPELVSRNHRNLSNLENFFTYLGASWDGSRNQKDLREYYTKVLVSRVMTGIPNLDDPHVIQAAKKNPVLTKDASYYLDAYIVLSGIMKEGDFLDVKVNNVAERTNGEVVLLDPIADNRSNALAWEVLEWVKDHESQFSLPR
jgi:hypothetical protein